MKLIETVTVVIRAVGERTEDACISLTMEQVKNLNIFVIHEIPFSSAVKKTFELGLENNKKWTLAIDADVLIRKNAIPDLINSANSSNYLNKLFVYQGSVLCKVFGKPRPAGFHLYQTKFLKKALSYCDETKNNIKPESSIYKKMNELGYVTYVSDKLYALHDYEQYYQDNFRNGFLQAKKHPHYCESFMKYWGENAELDSDYRAMLHGWISGVSHRDTVRVDKNYFQKIVKKDFLNYELKEKKELDLTQMSPIKDLIETTINSNRLKGKIHIIPNPSKNRYYKKIVNLIALIFIKTGNQFKKLSLILI